MKISRVHPASSVTNGQSAIDRQIELLNKRKQAIFRKITDVINGDDNEKVKKEKIEALRLEIEFIDLQIQQLIRKKTERQRQKQSDRAIYPLPPSPSELIQPDHQPGKKTPYLDFTV